MFSLPLALMWFRMSVSLMFLPFSILEINKAIGQGHVSHAGVTTGLPHTPKSRLRPFNTILYSVLLLFIHSQMLPKHIPISQVEPYFEDIFVSRVQWQH